MGSLFAVGLIVGYAWARVEDHRDAVQLRASYGWNLHRLVHYCLPTDTQIR